MPDKTENFTSLKSAEFLETTQQWNAAWLEVGDALANFLAAPPKAKPVQADIFFSALTAVNNAMFTMLVNPLETASAMTEAYGDWAKLSTSFWSITPDEWEYVRPERGDRRFNNEEWKNSRLFSFLKQAYLLTSKQLRALVKNSAGDDPAKNAFAAILVDQFLNAVAPTNSAFTNPQVIRKTIDTAGANLVSGFAKMLNDFQDGKGLVRRRAPNTFKLGENLATTPGGVIYQNDLMQLIQYAPTTDKVRRRPLLYVPPLVNKFYMIDLQPKSSLIRWLVEQGETVFVISWVDPDESHRHCEVEDYIGRGVLEAMDFITDVTGEKAIDLFGFCMGGTLIAMAQAVLAARKQHARIGTSTLIGSQIDFSDMREWAAFVTEAQANTLDSQLEDKGYIDKSDLQQLFSIMRSNDLIWSSYINHYLLDTDAPPSDLLFWFEDGSHIPQAFLRSYNRSLLLNNHLRVPGEVTILGEKLDLTKCKNPMMLIALKEDHVSSWDSVYRSAQYFGGPVEFVLGGSGHNAGVINPPAANKHGYWLNDELVDNPELWLQKATKQEGSWWPYWAKWLEGQPGNGLVDARPVGCGRVPQLEPAPGSFVTKAAP